ncbi:MAG: penicillin-binding protein activator [Gammaproteobacteria bacterium]|nr:penicillin-binding protein activator [Gammaproteobacteria bacterium]
MITFSIRHSVTAHFCAILLAFGLILVGCTPVPIEQSSELPPTDEIETPQTTEEPLQEAIPIETPEIILPEPELEPIPPELEERPVTTFGLQNEEQVISLDDPWKLVEQANSLPAERALGLQIRAIEEFLNLNQVEFAITTLRSLAMYPETIDDRFHVEILRGRILLAQGNTKSALAKLTQINLEPISNQSLRIRYFETLANAYAADGKNLDEIAIIIEIHDLSDDEARIDWQKQIIEKILNLNPLDRSLLAHQSMHANTSGWISLAETLDYDRPEFLSTDFLDWRKFYPDHPANLDSLTLSQEPYELTKYQRIALLLPLTSDVGSAAQAFYDGFMDAASRYQSNSQADIVLYDIGNSTGLSRIYYRAAIDDGANLIVGPLGSEAANSLLEGFTGEIDTLMVTDISDQTNLPRLFAFSLSPEEEAKLVAKKAWNDGHRQVTVFRSANSWGNRVASAFVEYWESIGGVVVKNEFFQTDQVDYSTTIQNFLGIDTSIQRRKSLEKILDQRLKFAPRRNEDMDFIFLAANSTLARIVVPQLRFFQAHNLPVYATSYVYSGTPNPELDADLNGVIFPDMHWMLQGVETYRRSRTEQDLAEISVEKEVSEEEFIADLSEGESDQSELDQQPKIGQEENPEQDTQPLLEDLANSDTPDPSPDLVGTQSVETEEENTDQVNTLANNLAPYRNTGLDRIYALGLQSFLLAPRLNALRNDPTLQFSGPAMTVSLAENGEVLRQPLWLVFREGLPDRIHKLTK